MSNIHDLEFYQRKALSLINKAGERRPFIPNLYQKRLNKIAEDRSKPLRLLVLKCRQIGASTWASSFLYHRIATQFDKSAMIIADSAQNSSGLFSMIKRFYEHSPDVLKPLRRYSNQSGLFFNSPNDSGSDLGLNSSVIVTTAGNMAAGRSKTLQFLHASEFAYWANASEVMTGLFQAVPYLPNTGIIIESTANGVAGTGAQFYELCMRALDGDSSYRFEFFDWKENPEYEMDATDFKATNEEQELMKKYPALTARKVMFRRYKINNEMGSALLDPRDQFSQEYPNSPVEAFVTSGRPVFRPEAIHEAINKASSNKGIKCRFDGVTFIEDSKGSFTLFKKPVSGQAYAIGADVAEGLEVGDFSTASVLDKNFEQVAVYCGHIEPDRFGSVLVSLAKYYNNAVLAPENNNHGHAVLASIKSLGYFKLFKREVQEELGREVLDKVGWLTTAKSKMLMVDELVGAFRDGSIKINCINTLKEMMMLVIEDDGNIILNSRDRVVALAISIQAIKQAALDSEFKASSPTQQRVIDPTRLSLQDKLKYYNKINKE